VCQFWVNLCSSSKTTITRSTNLGIRRFKSSPQKFIIFGQATHYQFFPKQTSASKPFTACYLLYYPPFSHNYPLKFLLKLPNHGVTFKISLDNHNPQFLRHNHVIQHHKSPHVIQMNIFNTKKSLKSSMIMKTLILAHSSEHRYNHNWFQNDHLTSYFS